MFRSAATIKQANQLTGLQLNLATCMNSIIAVKINALWIGMHCRRTNNYFEWLSEDPVLYTSWDRREPNAYTPDENCVEVYPVSNRQ